jgi:HPt (histidine-containing phosphotransfer) domain-containing protein
MDILELKNYLNCDNNFLESIIQKFIAEVQEITKTIEIAAAAEKWPVVKLNAHKMLSSVKIFEINELIILLEKIEISAEKQKNIPQLKKDVEKLIGLSAKAILDVQTALEELN